MSQPPLELTPIGTKISHTKLSHLDLTPVGAGTSDTKPLTVPTELSKVK